jgi:malate dehydrogenase (oxaloacetate-decarboxylating)
MDIYQKALDEHARLKGKISTSLRALPDTAEALSTFYSPGVAEVSRAIAADHSKLKDYTWTNNLVAVISDGSSVLGLGDIGPEAAMPVMEGKAMLFKHFAGIDAVPIVLDVHTPDEIVSAVKAIAKSFGGINLEDIAAPQCFEVEERLKEELEIPVMHDDQHGTAIVVLAGLINAMKVVGKDLQACRIVLIGAGAAGTAIARLLTLYKHPEIIAVDSQGVIMPDRANLTPEKKFLSTLHMLSAGYEYTLKDALMGADIVIGVSRAGMITAEDVKIMSDKAVIFALANPDPEIMPDVAKEAGAMVVATGRSDYPNQVNNLLAFPGIFRGALDKGVKQITDDHKLAAAMAIASLVDNPTADHVIPSPLDPRVCEAVAESIR